MAKIPLTLEEFIYKANLVHNYEYDYTLFEYKGSKVKGIVICHVHGKFTQIPNAHLQGRGCPKCANIVIGNKLCSNLCIFVSKAQIVHNFLYIYDNFIYIDSKTKGTITCKDHGVFLQTPSSHLKGHGCPKCSYNKNRVLFRKAFEKFELEAIEVHASWYIYSKFVYKGNKIKGTIICPDHGEFQQIPADHLDGHGCPKCGINKIIKSTGYTLAEFTNKAIEVHGDRYDYSNLDFKKVTLKGTILCREHGPFNQILYSHLQGRGCPSCSHHYSKPHKEIEAYLDSLNIAYQSNIKSVIPPLELDIWIPTHNLAIEFNGDYWHSIGPKSKVCSHLKHQQKFLVCQEKGIILLQIEENEWNGIEGKDKWKSIIQNRLFYKSNQLESEILLDNRYGEWTYYINTHTKIEDLPPKFKLVKNGLKLYDAGYQRWDRINMLEDQVNDSVAYTRE